MEFEINSQNWTIKQVELEYLKKKYKEDTGRDANFVHGLCQYSQQIIFLNKEMIDEAIIKILKHELTHCFIWNYGLYNATERVGEEVICDIVASSNDFINRVVENYKEYIDSLKCKPFKKDELNILPCRKEEIIDEK